MSRFLEALHELLHTSESGQRTPVESGITKAWAHATLLKLLQRIEDEEASGTTRRRGEDRPEVLLRVWASNDVVVRFCRGLGTVLIEAGMANGPGPELHHLVEVGLARKLDLPDRLDSAITTAALDRLVEDNPVVDPYRSVERYALENRLQREDGPRRSLTSLGRAFLQLTGRDRVRWLLCVESHQSTGALDPWRISSDAASYLLTNLPTTSESYNDWEMAVPWPTLRRMLDLDIVDTRLSIEPLFNTYALTPLGRELLTEVAREEKTPLSIMARTLLDDLTLSVGPPSPEAQQSSAADAVARQARLVAHELNNALVPVKTQLGRLYRELKTRPPEEALTLVRPAIDEGIDAAFRFIRNLTEVSKLVATPSAPFEVAPAIEDALAELGPAGIAVDRHLDSALPPLIGARHLFVQAVLNLVRNAVQATSAAKSAQISVSATTTLAGRGLRLQVDDNGPGVPPERRTLIFQDGISHTEGGLGLGLGIVKRVVDELGGSIECQASDLGGARFVILLPAAGVVKS